MTFDKNDDAATGTMSAQTINSGASAALTANGFSKTDYTFAGWATSSFGDVVYTNQQSYTMGTSNVTLYAKWAINQYTVAFDSQGGRSVTSQTIVHGATATAPADPTWDDRAMVTVPGGTFTQQSTETGNSSFIHSISGFQMGK